MIRTDAGCSVSRFAELVGVPRRTYHGRLARRRGGEGAVAGAGGGPHRTHRGEIRRGVAGVGLPQDRRDRRHRWLRRGFSVERETGDGAPRAAAAGALPGRTPPARRGAPGSVRGSASQAQPGVAGGLLNVRDHRRGHLGALRRRRLRRQDRPGVPGHDHPGRHRPDRRPCRAPSTPPRRCWAVASSRTASTRRPAKCCRSWSSPTTAPP